MKQLAFVSLLFLSCAAYSQSVIEYYNRANAQAQYQNHEDAIRLLTRSIALKADFADAYALRGDCYYYTKAYDKAIADYLSDDKLKKDRSSYSLACTYALSGNKDDAFRALEANLASEYKIRMTHIVQDADLASLRSDPRWESLTKKQWYSDYEAALNESDVKFAADDLPGAIQAITKAIRLDPSKSKAFGSRAILYLRSGNLQKCLEDLNKAIGLDPGKSVYYGNRGYTNNKLGNSAAALEDYEAAIQLDPTNLLYYDLAIARYSSGNKIAALDAITRHMDYFTKDEMGYYFGGIIASETERFSEAINYLNKAIEINTTIPQFYMKRGDAQFLMKKYQEAITDYDIVIRMEPSSGEAHYIRGNARASLMDREGACGDWRKAVELGFQDTNGYIRDLCK